MTPSTSVRPQRLYCLANRIPRWRDHGGNRRGAVLVLASLLIVMELLIVALAVDLGYLLNARVELQRSADAAALAAVWEYSDNLSASPEYYYEAEEAARAEAQTYAGLNLVGRQSPNLDPGSSTSPNPDSDVMFGYVADVNDPAAELDTTDPARYNAARVRVRRTTGMNGEVPTFFGRAFGVDSRPLDATATAVFARDIAGFKSPSEGYLDILPFALDLETWENLKNGNGSDNWRWDDDDGRVEWGWDGALECNLYPQGTGSPGNRGTVDIGAANNSSSDIARQILHGVNADDLAYLGGELTFDSGGKMYLNGDTGISAGFKDELASTIGDVRMIPVFSHVQGNGNNATYTIVKWVGVRIMDVKLTGPMNQKRLMIQPATVVSRWVIPSDGEQQLSEYIVSPAILAD